MRERGVFGAIFGILISIGIYFAFDVGYMIIESFSLEKLFIIPSIFLAAFWIIDVLVVRNTPEGAGFEDLVVVGDIFELDLCLPFAMGAKVGLLANDFTPEYEKNFLHNHPRGAVLTSVKEIPEFAFGA